ncbi:MAG: PTS sugar transporter subunit IIA [Planctomycetota bacterium]|nr:MAG: PTS sugar transporter subunit IIA [Planctomycetota bacterium]
MSFADLLRPEAVLIGPDAADKWQLLRRLAEALVACGALPAERLEEAVAALEARERSVSTGMEQGIAVPHAALEDLERVLAALAVVPDGIEFQSLDGQPARIVVLLLVPRREKVLHVKTLTEVARRLGDEDFRRRILACRSGEEVVALWS